MIQWFSSEPDVAGERSQDGGDNWVTWSEQPCGLGTTEFDDSHLQLMAHPTQTQVLFLRCAQGLYRSDNGGDSWTQLSPAPGQLLAPGHGVPGRILLSRETGLWASTDNGESWQLLMTYPQPPGLPLFLPSVLKPQP